mmetsp:Transcript_11172/g.39591  ORF Transcript_11172/g.39591 Transcript_11172/m.39591 type:complete len:255 (+) Transcript_11172:401-1165(+)
MPISKCSCGDRLMAPLPTRLTFLDCWLLPLWLLLVSSKPFIAPVNPPVTPPKPPGVSPPPPFAAARGSTAAEKFFFWGQGACSAAAARPLWEECCGLPGFSSNFVTTLNCPRRISRSSFCHTSMRASLLKKSSFRVCASKDKRSTFACMSSKVQVLVETCFASSSCLSLSPRASCASVPMESSRPRMIESMLSIWSSTRLTVRVCPSRLRCSTHLPSFCTPRPCRKIAKYLLVRSKSPLSSEMSMLSRCTMRCA